MLTTPETAQTSEEATQIISEEDVKEITDTPPGETCLRRAGNTIVLGGIPAGNSRVYFIRPIKFDEEDIERVFALKVLPKEPLDKELLLTEFEREKETLRLLNCAGFPRAYQTGEGWILMDYFAGNTLWSELHSNWLKKAKEARKYLLGSAELIKYLHNLKTPEAPHGISHRDIKPTHIIRSGDRICLIDFGASRINGSALSEDIAYTQVYAPPEVLEDRENGTSTPHDVFSFARTCGYTLTGTLPLNKRGLEFKTTQIPRDRFSIPERLARVINASLADAPEDRPTIDELVTALYNWETEEKPKRSWFTIFTKPF